MRPIPPWLIAAMLLHGAAALAAPKIWQEPLTGMPFVAIPKGCFQMGSKKPVAPPEDLALRHVRFESNLSADERPQHEVCVDAFLMGQYEVRADDWQKLMAAPPPEGSGQAPAGGISWDAAQALAKRLTEQSDGRHRFRLPTEAEWEYACRAGTKNEATPQSDNRKDVAWYGAFTTHIEHPADVGQRKANAWGLYDMLGNVWEWVEDAYRVNAYAKHALFNPLQRDATSREHVIRGASYLSEDVQVRCANRSSYAADGALGQIGLRLVRQP